MPEKEFKSYEELISLLISRGVDISTSDHKSFAKKALQHEGYYNLINGYSKLFIATTIPTERYKPGTTVEELFYLLNIFFQLKQI